MEDGNNPLKILGEIMRNIKVNDYVVKNPDGKETNENILVILNVLLAMKDPKDLPRGYEQFKLFTKLNKAFEKAYETKVLVLEEDVYKFLKQTIEHDIPSSWGINQNIVNAINEFMNVKEE